MEKHLWVFRCFQATNWLFSDSLRPLVQSLTSEMGSFPLAAAQNPPSQETETRCLLNSGYTYE